MKAAPAAPTSQVHPEKDVAEKNGAYTVTAELPGVKKEDIRVSIDGAQVTLEAQAKRESEASQEVDEAKADAKFRDGVLELTLPKKQAAARKPIHIQ